MSKIGSILKVGALSCALAVAQQAIAASTFTVPMNYTVKLVDGQDSDFNYNRFNRQITLAPGRHQIVLLFEGSFGNSRDSRLVQAANPIVVELANMPDNVNYTFKYDTPRDEYTAEKFSRSQRISLVNANTNAALSQEEASYYILSSDSGFAILRDYRDDLASVGRLYAPNPALATSNNTQQEKYNEQGVLTVQARSGGGNVVAKGATATGVSATVANAAHAQKAESQAIANGQPQQVQSFSNPAAAATYNQLVDLYNKADDATKLQFVKYIMAN